MIWDVDPVLGTLQNGGQIRYYGVLLMLGVGLAGWALSFYATRAGVKDLTGTAIAAVAVALVSAHLIHLVFYEPQGLTDPTRIWALGAGLSSHGAYLGGLLVMFLGSLKQREGRLVYLDLAMSSAVILIPFVRLGNLMNSEIVGRPWDGPWALVFVRLDCREAPGQICDAPARHPTQLYEALLGVCLIALAAYLQLVWRSRLRPGAIFAMLLVATFGGRILVELTREAQVVDAGWAITMGQWLSVPFLLFGAGLLVAWRDRLLRPPVVETVTASS